MVKLNQSCMVATVWTVELSFWNSSKRNIIFLCSSKRYINYRYMCTCVYTPYSLFHLFLKWNLSYFQFIVPTGANFHPIPVISKTFFRVILHRLYLRIRYCDKILNYDNATFCLHNPHVFGFAECIILFS